MPCIPDGSRTRTEDPPDRLRQSGVWDEIGAGAEARGAARASCCLPGGGGLADRVRPEIAARPGLPGARPFRRAGNRGGGVPGRCAVPGGYARAARADRGQRVPHPRPADLSVRAGQARGVSRPGRAAR